MVVHAFTPSTHEADAGLFLWILGQPGLQSKLQDSQSHKEKPCLKNNLKEKMVEYVKDT